jgi:prepilin-type N-terminal cleavage/methylation domain-containing protein
MNCERFKLAAGQKVVLALKSRGFTLIELLVVIAIIALLMSILMPALSRAKDQAKAVICQSNLHEWGPVMKMYTDDNEGLFMPDLGLSWDYLREYYRDDELLLCPMASKPYTAGARNPFGAHFYYNGLASYGHNSWICSQVAAQFQTPERMWRTPNVKGAGYVPMVMDCAGYQNASPWHRDDPPAFDGEFIQGTSLNEMKYACLNRHSGYTNMVFMDYSVKRMSLKRLWDLHWHRDWNPSLDPPPVWPDWMLPLPE